MTDTMTQAPVDNLVRAWVAPGAASLRSTAQGGDGRTLFGHFAVFNKWTEINSMWEGDFMERLAPGSFTRTFAERGDQVKVLYDHGRDPQIGNKPLGPITDMREDKIGAAYEVHLIETPYNNDFIIPASRENLLGASFRFRVMGESWVTPTKSSKSNPKGLDERTITDVELYEFGPVTFPAYADASAGLRSMTDDFMDRLRDDPMFLARFTERVGFTVVEKLLQEEKPKPPAPAPARVVVNTEAPAATIDTLRQRLEEIGGQRSTVQVELERYTITPGDESVPELAAALDAVIDAAGDAADEGDLDTCAALLDACDVTADALMVALGLRDPDELTGEAPDAGPLSLNSAGVAADGATADTEPDTSRSDSTDDSTDGQPSVDKPKTWDERKAFVRRLQMERVSDG